MSDKQGSTKEPTIDELLQNDSTAASAKTALAVVPRFVNSAISTIEHTLQPLDARRNTSTGLALANIWEVFPPLPGYAMLQALMGGRSKTLDTSATLDPYHSMLDNWYISVRMAVKLSGITDSEHFDAGSDRAEQAMAPLAAAFRSRGAGKTPGAKGAFAVIDNIQRHYPGISRHRALDTLPFTLLGILGLTAEHQLGRDNPTMPPDDVQTAVDYKMQQLCRDIQARRLIVPQQGDAAATVAQARAAAALAECYFLTDERKYHAVAWLASLYLSDTGIADAAVGQREIRSLRLALEEFGIEVMPSLDDMLKFGGANQEYTTARDMALRRKAEYSRRIDLIYASITSYYYARRLVEAIASGRLSYTLATDLSGLIPYTQNPLEVLAEDIADRKRLEEDHRAAENARVTDLGFINATLGLAPAEELRQRLVRPGSGATRSAGGQTTSKPEQIALGEYRNLELYRAYVLARLIQEFPDSQIYFLPLKRGGAGSKKEGFDVRRTETYIFLVTPEGNVIAEYPEPEHATLLMRAEILRPGETWNAFFNQTVDQMVARGLVRIEHPRQEDLAHDQYKTSEAYVAFLYYLIIEPLARGERLPDSTRLRRMQRVHKLGKTATGQT